jgi:hypothetical protein
VVGHEDDAYGERRKYEVSWPDGTRTWQDATEFAADAERCEGSINAVIVYEVGLLHDVPAAVELHSILTRHRPLRDEHNAVAASIGRASAIRQPATALKEMDVSLTRLPYNPEVLPWRAREPMTEPGRLKMHDIHNWIASTTAEFQFRGRWDKETGRILNRWLRSLTVVQAPVITLNTVDAMERKLILAASEMETVMPKTDLSILFGHSPLHFPEQMRFLGPLDTHNMWGFEGSSHVHDVSKIDTRPHRAFGWLRHFIHSQKDPEANLANVVLLCALCLLRWS